MPFLEFRRVRSEEHTSELQSHSHLVCRLLLEKKNDTTMRSLARQGPASGRLINAGLRRRPASPLRGGHARPIRAPPGSSRDFFFFFLNDTAPPEIYPLPLPAALPISALAEAAERHDSKRSGHVSSLPAAP